MKFFAKLSHISGLENTSRARAHIRYIMRNGEGNFTVGTLVKDTPRDTGASWGAMIDWELMRRKDARYQSRLIVAVPNEFSEGQTRGYIAGLEREFFGDMKYTVAHHDNPGNKHLHFVYNDTLVSSKRKNLEIRKKSFLSDLKNFSEKHFREQGIEVETVLPGEGRARLSRAAFEAKRETATPAALMVEAGEIDNEIYAAAEEHLRRRAGNGQSRGDTKPVRTAVAERPAASGDGQAAIGGNSGAEGGLAPMPGSNGRGDRRADAAGAGTIKADVKKGVGGNQGEAAGKGLDNAAIGYSRYRVDWPAAYGRAVLHAAAGVAAGTAGVSRLSNIVEQGNSAGKSRDAGDSGTVKNTAAALKAPERGIEAAGNSPTSAMASAASEAVRPSEAAKKSAERRFKPGEEMMDGTWTRWLKHLIAKKEKTEKLNESLKTDKPSARTELKQKFEDNSIKKNNLSTKKNKISRTAKKYEPGSMAEYGNRPAVALDPAEEAARKKRFDDFFAPDEKIMSTIKNNLSTKKENDFMVDFDFKQGKYVAYDMSDPKNAGRKDWTKNAIEVKALDSGAALNAAGIGIKKIIQTGKRVDESLNGPESSGPGR